MPEKFDLAVVGGGLAGLTCAYVAAKAGLNVIVIERGEYAGAKNLMGGVLYVSPFLSLIPGFLDKAPLERNVVEESYWFLHEQDVFKLGHRSGRWNGSSPNAYTVFRSRFDQWYADEVRGAGALLVTATNAINLLFDKEQVVGVVTDRPDGEVLADTVVLADGANSLVAEQAGLHGGIAPENVALAVKEVIELPEDVIDQRFGLQPGAGAAIEMFGSFSHGALGMAFLYTNRGSVSLGGGGILSQLVDNGDTPEKWLEQIRRHPAVAPLIDGGRVKEYGAHLIPEGGFYSMPPLS